MKTLFIGNSHTYFNDMPHLFTQLCAAGGIPMEAVMLAHGGMGLDFHEKQEEVHFNIRYGGFDYVVLQHRAHPFDSEEAMFDGGRKLHQEIAASGAKTVLYMTWTEQNNEAGQPRMADAYLRLGRELQALVAPVGLAWWEVIHAHPEIDLYYTDGQHASLAGSTLAACSIYSAIFQKPAPTGERERVLAEAAFAQTEKLRKPEGGQ